MVRPCGSFYCHDHHNEMRPCYALGYDIPNNYEQKYRNGELEMRNIFKNMVLTETPKFVLQKLSTPVKEDETKDFDLSTLINEALKK
ncbi:MAG: hypothetical protein K6C98_00700 [Treponema sp.]|nr:hypothetical protein [Treponema sp.]